METGKSSGFLNDLDEFARLSFPSRHAARSGPTSDVLAEYSRLDPAARLLVNRLLDHPQEADWQELFARGDGRELAQWMLTLPPFEKHHSSF